MRSSTVLSTLTVIYFTVNFEWISRISKRNARTFQNNNESEQLKWVMKFYQNYGPHMNVQ